MKDSWRAACSSQHSKGIPEKGVPKIIVDRWQACEPKLGAGLFNDQIADKLSKLRELVAAYRLRSQ